MVVRIMALLGTSLVVASGLAQAQAPPSPGVQSASETTRTTERKQTSATTRSDALDQLGWELAAGDEGVRVERITADSPIAKARLQEKDVIKSIDGENVLTVERVQEVLKKVADTGETTTEIVVLRDGEELSYLLPLESVSTEGSRTTQTTTLSSQQADLVAMIQQLQEESQQQQVLLQTLLTEVQNLRVQLGGTPDAQINNTTVTPGGTQGIGIPQGGGNNQGAGNSAAPRRGGAGPNAPVGRGSNQPRNNGQTTPNRP